jgi:hypothetical protein
MLSLLRMPCAARLPTPGHEKTVSTTTAPPSRMPSVVPAVVSTGVMALRSAWRSTMVRATAGSTRCRSALPKKASLPASRLSIR